MERMNEGIQEEIPGEPFGDELGERYIPPREVAFVEFVFDSIMKRCKNNPSLIGNADRAFYQKTHNGIDPPDPRKLPTERLT